MYPFYSALIAMVIAQGVKPLTYYLKSGKWDLKQITSSGGLPSSHTAVVSSLVLSVGIKERFSSTLFAITLIFAMIIAYDAMNVRYYAGKNIQVTKKLIEDLAELIPLRLDNPAYQEKMKDILGHTEVEVVAGVILGIIVALVINSF